jgi:formylglycine-generating enzyme required for sulfatase activity
VSFESPSEVWREGGEQAARQRAEVVGSLLDGIDEALEEAETTRPNDPPPYRIEGEIGRGGMGVVLRAFDSRLRRTVAMKLARGERGGSVRLKRFLREARLTGQLHHPNIVPVHELGRNADGEHFFTMPLVQGQRLDHVFELANGKKEGWSLARALGVLIQVCDTLAYAHKRGVVHRDVKPQNVMVGEFGEIYVLDWGLAKELDEPEELDPASDEPQFSAPDVGASAFLRTQVGAVVGSPSYVAPEQAAGRSGEVGPRVDVYSVGAMLYTLLAGRPPYTTEEDSSGATFEAVRGGPPDPIQDLAAQAPPELFAICERAMARRPEDRYAGVAELGHDLRAYAEGRVVKAHRVGAIVELRKWVLRNRSVATWMAVTVLVVLCALAALYGLEARRRLAEARIADRLRIPYLTEFAQRLWPATPDRVPDLERWIAQAVPCADRVASSAQVAGLRKAVLGPREESEDVQRLVNATSEDELRAFRALIASVQDRLAFAREIGWRSIWEPSVAHRWQAAIASIADPGECGAYRGLSIEPQLGLVPIGRDPCSGLWEFAHLQTGREPRRTDGLLELDESTGLVFVLVPPGEFRMGAAAGDTTAFAWERPALPVALDAFLISKYEMTQAQWRRFTLQNPSEYSLENEVLLDAPDLHPVESVSWTECQRVLLDLGLTLPTEAQWEYAARANTTDIYWTGPDHLSLREGRAGNLLDLCALRDDKDQQTIERELVDWIDDGFALHSPVGSFAANAFGLHDVSGNVWEWCLDWLTPYEVPPEAGDGLRSEPAPGRQRAERGGSFRNYYTAQRLSHRENLAADARQAYLGVRPARALTRSPASSPGDR